MELRHACNDIVPPAGTQPGMIVYYDSVQKSRPTQNKRARERARQEKQKDKAARRQEAKSRKSMNPEARGGEDPDIAGIVPGPQPNPWGDEPEAEPDSDNDE